jgi:two-component system OmpR family response regulator
VLVAVDDPVLAKLVPASLRFAGFETHLVGTGAEVLAERSRLRPHLLVLDTRLRSADGVTVAEQLRRFDGHPVLFLTASDVPRPPALTLTVGGDDYLATPFSLDELTARVRAMLRRAGDTDIPAVLRFADLEFDEDAQIVHRAGVPIQLTPRERQILRHLLVNPGRIVTRAQIHEHVWPYDHTGSSRSLDVHICTLRRKLDHHGPPLIRTLHGTGYLLQIPEAASLPADA